MSCNGCRVLRKGCSESCILRTCLYWIPSPKAQANATLFLSRFFGRSDLMSLIGGVPAPQRPALFQSLLFEACGRSVNPVNGAVGLLMSGNWTVCQAAVETVMAGGTPRPQPPIAPAPPLPARVGPPRPIRWQNQLTLASFQPFLARNLTPAQLQEQVELQLNGARGVRRGGMWLSCTRAEKRRRVSSSEMSDVTSAESVEKKELLNLFE